MVKAFLSYPHSSETLDAAVSAFQASLQGELELRERGSSVFVDTKSIPPGAAFHDVLHEELAASDVFLPLESPTWYESKWCREEFQTFVTLHKRGDECILLVLWVGLSARDFHKDDPLRQHLGAKQRVDWSKLRHRDPDDPLVRERTAELATALLTLTDAREGRASESNRPHSDISAALPGVEFSLMALPRGEPQSSADKAIIQAVWKAIDATEDHLRVLDETGADLTEPNTKLRELWTEAAVCLLKRAPDVSRLLREKATFWGNPANWDQDEARHADISMRNLRRVSMDLIDRLEE